MYFQYDTSGTPLGFIYNGTQYFYMTNQMGDVISITDNQGNELVQYEYDEWGTLASVNTTHNTEAEEQLAIINPLRYRGYYYDNETSYYYLQSRYYDSSICRFINSDNNKVARLSKNIHSGNNTYAYCYNDAINNTDSVGAFPWSTVAKMLLSVLSQYGGDIISNIIDGKTGKNILKPCSTFGAYVAAAASALVGGNKLSSDYKDICSFFKEKQGVVISTIHSVKGEEYNTVIGFCLLNGVIPHWNYIFNPYLKPVRENETKKLLYVLMSRAKQNLFLFSEKDRTIRNGNPLLPTDELSKIK